MDCSQKGEKKMIGTGFYVGTRSHLKSRNRHFYRDQEEIPEMMDLEVVENNDLCSAQAGDENKTISKFLVGRGQNPKEFMPLIKQIGLKDKVIQGGFIDLEVSIDLYSSYTWFFRDIKRFDDSVVILITRTLLTVPGPSCIYTKDIVYVYSETKQCWYKFIDRHTPFSDYSMEINFPPADTVFNEIHGVGNHRAGRRVAVLLTNPSEKRWVLCRPYQFKKEQ